ncbi:ankyrin repeat-containing domain protein [Stachybotrys elegans]|uniref:Ankyrin repeat-containing domain protein n=1 Tax=Stachybotrys elegans TaxID=80388 RepID=A0A8K0WVM1_9HYPO|nr:ankyrin repeat-containing domain protein [Stachybotrys elegans]
MLSYKPDLDPPAAALEDFEEETTPLAEAVMTGNERLIAMLEAAGALDNLAKGGRYRPLFMAVAEAGNENYARALTARATTSRSPYRDTGLAMLAAVKDGHMAIAWTLLDAGAIPDAALLSAIEKRDRGLVYAILNGTPGLEILDFSVLGKAAEWFDADILRDLMPLFQRFSLTYSDSLMTLCKRCIEMNNVPLFKYYIENVAVGDKDTLYHCLGIAIESDHEEMVQMLLHAGANCRTDDLLSYVIQNRPEFLGRLLEIRRQPPKVERNVGVATLKYLLPDRPGNIEMIKALLDAGVVNLNALRKPEGEMHWVNEYGLSKVLEGGFTPLGLAIVGVPEIPDSVREAAYKDPAITKVPSTACGTNLKAIKMFLEAGSDPNASARVTGGSSKTALMLAIEFGTEELVELLIAHGANVNLQPNFHTSRSPLQYAAQLGRLDMVRLLLKHGADVNSLPHATAGGTALQLAAIAGSCPLASELLDRGATIDALPSRVDGRWPLEGAAEHGRLDMIRFLWSFSEEARAGGVHCDGFTERHCLRAMSFARENGHMGCVDLIENLSGVDSKRLDTDEYGASWLAY